MIKLTNMRVYSLKTLFVLKPFLKCLFTVRWVNIGETYLCNRSNFNNSALQFFPRKTCVRAALSINYLVQLNLIVLVLNTWCSKYKFMLFKFINQVWNKRITLTTFIVNEIKQETKWKIINKNSLKNCNYQ